MSEQSDEKIYKIGQAAKLVDLKSYVLRFWEGEFEQLEPIRTPSGQRLYNDGHIRLIRKIKTLLHDEGLTIEGARKRLDVPEDLAIDSEVDHPDSGRFIPQLPLFSNAGNDSEPAEKRVLKDVHSELLEIKKILG